MRKRFLPGVAGVALFAVAGSVALAQNWLGCPWGFGVGPRPCGMGLGYGGGVGRGTGLGNGWRGGRGRGAW